MRKLKPEEKFKVIREGIEYDFEIAEEGGYVVTVPLYSSCVSQGETFEEALANIEDALLGCLAAAQNLNLSIPQELEPLLRQVAKP
jgi:predicted RNase H-like HicB family nuclease